MKRVKPESHPSPAVALRAKRERLFHLYLPFAHGVFHTTRRRYRLYFQSLEDAQQELLLVLWKRILTLPDSEIESPPDLRPYLALALKGSVLESIRAEHYFRYAPELAHSAFEDLLPEHATWDYGAQLEARSVLALPLPFIEHEVLRRLLFDGQSYEEIALALSISLKQVYTARKHAATLLAQAR